jgi:hypothetical protein
MAGLLAEQLSSQQARFGGPVVFKHRQRWSFI